MSIEEDVKAHWYCVSNFGAATLCVDEEDARQTAANADRDYPHHAPHAATQLAPISALEEAEKASGWVSVDERLPEKNVEVLVVLGGISIPATGQYTGSSHDMSGWCYPRENNGICDDGSDPVVTHWMPLPPAPALAGS